jgi:CHAD domain-containing protein
MHAITHNGEGRDLSTCLGALNDAGFEASVSRRVSVQVLDTFDGRLHSAGMRLTATRSEGCVLALTSLAAAPVAVDLPGDISGIPSELPIGPIRARIEKRLGLRALLPIVQFEADIIDFHRCNKDGATIVAVRILTDIQTSGGLHVSSAAAEIELIESHTKAAAKAMRLLHDLGWPETEGGVSQLAAEVANCNVAGFDTSPTVDLRPDQPVLEGFVAVLANLAATMSATLAGTIADIDTEYLHDFRVAIRRARVVLGLAKAVLPDDVRNMFRTQFATLGLLTSPARDLDVYLLGWAQDVAALSDPDREALVPVLDRLRANRIVARDALVVGLQSATTTSMLASWSAWLASEGSSDDSAEEPGRSVGAHVGNALQRIERKVLSDGRAITADSPAADLHELRKEAKKLRYLLECFGGLPGRAAQKALVRQLKELQDNLGAHQDAEVQGQMLDDLRREIEHTASPATLGALQRLTEAFAQRQRAARDEFAERFEAFDTNATRRYVRELLRSWAA